MRLKDFRISLLDLTCFLLNNDWCLLGCFLCQVLLYIRGMVLWLHSEWRLGVMIIISKTSIRVYEYGISAIRYLQFRWPSVI